MKKLLLIALLTVQVVRAQFTVFYSTPNGSSLNAGSDTNAAAKVIGSNGGIDATTGVFTFASEVDLSAITTNDYFSAFADGGLISEFIAQIISVDDVANTVTFTTARSRRGTCPATVGIGITGHIGGALTLPLSGSSTNRHPMKFIGINDERYSYIGVGLTNGGGHPVMWMIQGSELGEYFTNVYTLPASTNFASGPYHIRGYTNNPWDGGFARIGYDTNIVFGGGISPQTFSGVGGLFVEQLWFEGGGDNAVGSVHNNGLVNFTTLTEINRCIWMNSWESACRLGGQGSIIRNSLFLFNQHNAASGKAAIELANDAEVRGNFIANQEYRPGDNGADGIAIVGSSSLRQTIEENIIYNILGSGIIQSGNGVNVQIRNNAIHKASLYGIQLPLSIAGSTNSSIEIVENNIVVEAHTGIRGNTTTTNQLFAPFISTNAFFQCTNGNVNFFTTNRVQGSIQLTVNPWTSPSTGDFSLNNTAGGGALLRAVGGPSFLTIHTNFTSMVQSYRDIGPAQHLESGGTSGSGGISAQ